MGERREPDVAGLGGYDLVRRLAVGGMAEVLLAKQTVRPGIERMVVIKSILPGLSEDADLVTMFLSEARIAAQLEHPNVVHIHDVTRLGTRPCIVMEHLVGLDMRKLGQRLREGGELVPIGLVAAIGEGGALGLGYAHRARGVDGQALSVVHRDVSPHNLFATVDGIVKVLDFGIAKSTAQIQATRDGTLKGKVAYMSPEQLRGEPLDGRSDLFALGAVLWELATGQALFARPSEIESFAAVLELQIQPPSALRPGIPEAFDRAILKALARDRTARPATGEDLARALHAIAEAECDGPPALALGRVVTSLVEQGDRPPTPVVGPAIPTLPGPGPAPAADATVAQAAATMSIYSAVPDTNAETVLRSSAPAAAVAPAAPDFAAGDLRLEGIEAPGREEELPTAPRASRPADAVRSTPAPPAPTPPPKSATTAEPPAEARRSSVPGALVSPSARDPFDPDGEELGEAQATGPHLELAVDVELERRAMGQPIPDVDRRAAAVADFGKPPFFLLTPLYTFRVIRRRAALADRARKVAGRIPILEAEAREAQAAIGRAAREGGADDKRIASEIAAVDAAAQRARLAADAEPSRPREARRVEKERLDAEVGLEERLADLGKAAVSRVAAPSATAPLEAAARAALRRLGEARTELELCERGREMFDPGAFRTGWILVFLACATATTFLFAAAVQAP